jgi:hypothetical protein
LSFRLQMVLTDYPKYTVKECLVERKGAHANEAVDSQSADESAPTTPSINESRYMNMPRFPLDVEMSDIMRKDSSGLQDYDDEEDNFAARRAVMAQGGKLQANWGRLLLDSVMPRACTMWYLRFDME